MKNSYGIYSKEFIEEIFDIYSKFDKDKTISLKCKDQPLVLRPYLEELKGEMLFALMHLDSKENTATVFIKKHDGFYQGIELSSEKKIPIIFKENVAIDNNSIEKKIRAGDEYTADINKVVDFLNVNNYFYYRNI